MNTTIHDAFAVTPVSRHVATAVRLTATGKPVEGAKPMQVCTHCFSSRQGGGLSINGACSNGCGFTEPDGSDAA